MLTFRSFSSATIKYSLFIFNLILVITGLILIGLGVAVKGVYTEYESLLDNGYLSASSLLITAGSLLCLFAFFGCCGAIKENRVMILVFSGLLIAVFILELATSITGYVLQDKTDALLNRTLHSTMLQYNHSQDITKLWDTVQRDLECCGVTKYTDWYPVIGQNTTLPLSCCDVPPGAIHMVCNDALLVLHRQPCKEQLEVLISHNAVSICVAALTILLLQLIGIIFSCYLAKFIKESSYESV